MNIYNIYNNLIKTIENNIRQAILLPSIIKNKLVININYNILYIVDEIENKYRITVFVGDNHNKVRDEFIIDAEFNIISAISIKYGQFKNI